MKTETPLSVDSANTERPTYRSTGDGVHGRTSNLPLTSLVETNPLTSHTPSLVLLALPITTAQHATSHNTPTTSESTSDSPMAVIEDTHTTHETSQGIGTSTTITYCLPLSTSEHTTVPVEVRADV
jgi:hypothetical protein